MAADKEYSTEELNYFRICSIITEIIIPGLREVFKREWNTRYKGKYDAWQEMAQNGKDLFNNESIKSQEKNSRELAKLRNGNTLEWDCTSLFFAILFSESIGRGLDPDVKKSVDKLRRFRNDEFAHVSSGKLPEDKFQTSVERVINAFTTLKLDTSEIEKVRNQKTFRTEELRVALELLEKEKMRNEEPRSFCVLPPKPSHEVFLREGQTNSILQEMKKLRITKPNEITVIYLSGNPGCGKSEIARQIGEKVFDGTPANETEAKFVFALNASSIDKMIELYVELAVSLKCDENAATRIGTSKELSQEKKLLSLKSLVTPKLRKYSSWLLIVDNVTDLKSIFRYLPNPGEKTDGQGQILVTTQDSRSIADDACHLSLSRGMNEDEAASMLSMISGIAADEEITFEVAKKLDLQPLALACAATYMKRVRKTAPTFSWQEYLQKLQCKREVTERVYKNISQEYYLTMTAAVKLAIENEVLRDEVMKNAFDFLSAMAPETIPLEYVVQYVTQIMPDEDKELVAATVASSSLILSSEGQFAQEISVHQVVHQCLNTILRPKINGKEEFHFLLNVIQAFATRLNSFDENSVNDIMITKSLVSHFVLISKNLSDVTNLNLMPELIFSEEEKTPDYLSSTGRICKVHGKYEESQSLFAISLMIKEKIYGDNNPALSSTLNNLGGVLDDLGRHQEANNYFARALTIQEEAFGENHPALASTLSNLGINLGNLGKHQEAKRRLKRALAIEEKAFNPNHPGLASTLNNLGNIYDDLGKHEKAKSCFEKALTIEDMVYGPNHPALASTLSNLGNSLGGLKQYREAKICLERALVIEETVFGLNHPVLASTLSNLGNILGDLDTHEEAKSCFERALAIEETALGPNHRDVASTLNNLGLCWGELGQHTEARTCFERALAIEEKAFDPNHGEIATTLNNLGLCLGELGQHTEARTCFERALAIEEKAFDPNHREIATTLNNLGLCLGELGQHTEAKTCFERELAIEEKEFGPNDPELASTLKNLGDSHRALGENEEAKSCYKRASAIEIH